MNRRLLFIIAAILCCQACEHQELMLFHQNEHIAFTARWADNEATKTMVHSDGISVYWLGNEDINLFYRDQAGKFSSSIEGSSDYAIFEGELNETTNVTTSSPYFWAVYPYSEDNRFDGESVTITVPNKQSAQAGSFADNLFPAIARTKGSELSFRNICGGICFTVMTSNVTSVVFKSKNGESLTGKVRVGFDEEGLPTIKELINGTDELTIQGSFIPKKRYYAVVLPKVLKEGITVTVKYGRYSSASFEINKPLTVKRSIFGQLDDIDVRTMDGVLFALNGLQQSLLGQYFSRQNIGGYPSFQIAMDCLGEDLVFPTAGNGWWANTGEVKWTANRNPNAYLTYYPWALCYRWISDANVILSAIENSSGDEGLKNMVKSQALLYRANFYFWLVQLYSDRYVNGAVNSQYAPPLILDTEDDPKPLSTVESVYSQIKADLDESIQLLSYTSNQYVNTLSKTDITIATAFGIRARVALAMQDWAVALDYAQRAIRASSYSLMSQAQYCEGFNDISNPEWMWGYDQLSDQTQYFYAFMAYMSWNFNSSNIRGCPKCINSKLYNRIPDTDIRKTLWDPTGKAWRMPTNSYSRYPYMNRKFAVRDYTSSVADANFMRVGEMYLIAAEAAAKSGDDATAQQYLYDLNKARDNGYQKSSKTGVNLLEEIYTYRRIELWGEGHRFLDLKRLNMPLDRTGANHDETVSGVMAIPAGDIRWRFAIPQDAIDENPLIPSSINE